MYPSSSSIIAVFYCQVCYPSVGFLWPCFLVSSHCNCCSLYGSEYPQQSLILKPRHCFLEYFSNLANSWHSKTAPTLQSWRPPKCSTVNGGVCVCDHRQPPIILVILTITRPSRLQKNSFNGSVQACIQIVIIIIMTMTIAITHIYKDCSEQFSSMSLPFLATALGLTPILSLFANHKSPFSNSHSNFEILLCHVFPYGFIFPSLKLSLKI